MEPALELNLVHLYPQMLNLYGDRGNIAVLKKRTAWRGIRLAVHGVGLNESFPDVPIDLVFMGGDQDREQEVVVDDLKRRHGRALEDLVQDGVPLLAVCGSYQLLQQYYRPAAGPDLVGLGIFPAHTIHPGIEAERLVGNVVADWPLGTIVGFENHGGRTFLDPGTEPLARVVKGFGNNGRDRTEGARVRNAFGTYIHGSLLPKNPSFADLLIELAARRHRPNIDLSPLDDRLEDAAHRAAMARAGA